jgi:hypothetical protein
MTKIHILAERSNWRKKKTPVIIGKKQRIEIEGRVEESI